MNFRMKKNVFLAGALLAFLAAAAWFTLAGCVTTGSTEPPPVASRWQRDFDVIEFTVPSIRRGTIIHLGKDSITGEGLNITDVSTRGDGDRMMKGELLGYTWVYLYSGDTKIGLAYTLVRYQTHSSSADYVVLGKSNVEKFLAEDPPVTADSVIPDTTDMTNSYVGNLTPSGGGDPFLNGTWVNSTGAVTTEFTFDNNNFSASINGSPAFRGSYSTSTSSSGLGIGSGTLRVIITHRDDGGTDFSDLTWNYIIGGSGELTLTGTASGATATVFQKK
jgi:hypothetical protein